MKKFSTAPTNFLPNKSTWLVSIAYSEKISSNDLNFNISHQLTKQIILIS